MCSPALIHEASLNTQLGWLPLLAYRYPCATSSLAERRASERADIRQLKALGVDGIAITVPRSNLNPAYEERLRQLVKEEFPQAAVTISSEFCREWREFERTSTCVLNVYTMLKLARFQSAFGKQSGAAGATQMNVIGAIRL